MKIAVCCCTYLRPTCLGYMIRCFERQDHADRELVILDDAGQYENCEGDKWRLVSVPERFPCLAAKRNAVVALASPGAEAFAPWDDDDFYLPWSLSAHAAVLESAQWSRPSLVLQPAPPLSDGRWMFRRHVTGGLYHAGWAYRRELFDRAGGYPLGYSGPEDRELMLRMERLEPSQGDPCADGREPAYIFGDVPGGQHPIRRGWHISGLLTGRDKGEDAWRRLGTFVGAKAQVVPTDPPCFDLRAPVIEHGVFPRPF